MSIKGIITKGIGGFYYVEVANATYECKARGVFRKERVTPLVGDVVDITINEHAENTIDKIYDRKNYLNRPPVANIDNLFIVVATVEPKPNFLVIDKLVAMAEYKNIEPTIIISKSDLASNNEIVDVYSKSGITVLNTANDIEKIKSLMKDKITAFTGKFWCWKNNIA